MNNPSSIAELGLTDDEIEAIALKYVAPGAKALRDIVPGLAPYQQSWQFKRIKAFLVDALAARRAPVADERAALNLPTMRSAFRITEQHGDPDPAKRQYNMVFKFRSIEALDAADDEWRAALASAPVAAQGAAHGRWWNTKADPQERQRAWAARQSRLAQGGAPVAGEAQHDTDSVCAWQVWWNQNKSRFTTTRQASFAAFAAAKDWRYAAPQASAEAFAKLQSAYVGACDQIGKLLAEKQASAPAAGEAQADQFIQAAIDQAPEPLRRLGEYLSRVLDEDQWASAERMLLGACNAASKASAEDLVRYCPGCGSVGPVEGEHRDCCPDGDEARMIPIALAKKCRDTFSIAVQGLLADRQRRDARNENVRTGHPFDVPAFDELCREHDVLGTAMSALCAVFWRAAELQPAPESGDRKAWEADMLAAGATHLGGDCWEWEVEDFEFKIWQMGVRRRQRTTESSSGGGNGHAE